MDFFNIFNTSKPSAVNKTVSDDVTTSIPTKQEFANQLKSALLNIGKDDNGKLIGVNLGQKMEFKKQVDNLVTEIQKSYKGYSTEITKAQKVKELNKNLTQNFKKNLEVMVDITNLLTSYVQLFEVMKKELTNINKLIGNETTNLDDIAYLESITQQQIASLQDEFNKQTSKLQDLYTRYDMKPEHEHISNARAQMTNIISSATNIWNEKSVDRRMNGGKVKKAKGGCKQQRKKSS